MHFMLDSSEAIWYGVCDVTVSVGTNFLRVAPSIASWSAILLPEIPTCPLTFCIVLLFLIHRIWWTMPEICSVLGWLR